jgi:hypothetical protein
MLLCEEQRREINLRTNERFASQYSYIVCIIVIVFCYHAISKRSVPRKLLMRLRIA